MERSKIEEMVNNITEAAADKFRAAGLAGAKPKGDNFTVRDNLEKPKPGTHPVEFKPGESNVDAIEKDEAETIKPE